MPDALALAGDRLSLLGPATGVDAAEDFDVVGDGGGRGDAELVRVGVGGAGLASRRGFRDPSNGDLEGNGRFGMFV